MAMQFLKDLVAKVDPQDMFKTIAKGADNVIFTNQERAAINMEVYQAQLEFAKLQANASSTSSKARRSLAFMVAIPFLLGKCLSMYLAVWGDSIKATQVDMINNGLAIYFGGVMTFYFGVYMYQKIQQKDKVKKVKELIKSKE